MRSLVDCRKCPARIFFVQMVKADGSFGRPAPLDAVATSNGNVRVTDVSGKAQGRVLSGDELRWAHAHGEELHTNHFMTCPEAQSFRKQVAK